MFCWRFEPDMLWLWSQHTTSRPKIQLWMLYNNCLFIHAYCLGCKGLNWAPCQTSNQVQCPLTVWPIFGKLAVWGLSNNCEQTTNLKSISGKSFIKCKLDAKERWNAGKSIQLMHVHIKKGTLQIYFHIINPIFWITLS